MLSDPEHLGTEGRVCAESRDIKNSITLDLESTTLLNSDTLCSQADIDPSDRILLLLVSFLTVFLSSPSFLRASGSPFHRYVSGLVLTPSCPAGVPIMRANQREWLVCLSVPENQEAIDSRTQRTTRDSVAKNNILKSHT